MSRVSLDLWPKDSNKACLLHLFLETPTRIEKHVLTSRISRPLFLSHVLWGDVTNPYMTEFEVSFLCDWFLSIAGSGATLKSKGKNCWVYLRHSFLVNFHYKLFFAVFFVRKCNCYSTCCKFFQILLLVIPKSTCVFALFLSEIRITVGICFSPCLF